MEDTKSLCDEVLKIKEMFLDNNRAFCMIRIRPLMDLIASCALYIWQYDSDIDEEICNKTLSDICDSLQFRALINIQRYDEQNHKFFQLKNNSEALYDHCKDLLINSCINFVRSLSRYMAHFTDENLGGLFLGENIDIRPINKDNYSEYILSINKLIDIFKNVLMLLASIDGDYEVNEAVAADDIILHLMVTLNYFDFYYDDKGEIYTKKVLDHYKVDAYRIINQDDETYDSDNSEDVSEQEASDNDVDDHDDDDGEDDYSYGDEDDKDLDNDEQLDTEQLLDELDGLIGLDSIKKDVRSIVSFIKICNARKEMGLTVPPVSYHLVFTGDPGTGKTTVARLVAKIYKALGILRKGQLIEAQRSTLVAGYLGQTAIKTEKVINEALGGVLFIDEAYSLVKENDQYGEECIETLLKMMDDHRDDLIVIVAGYSDLMREFIDSNPGLRSRFNKYFEFLDYSGMELYLIFNSLCLKSKYYIFDSRTREYVHKRFEEYAVSHDKNFGNARFVRNVFERAISAQAVRLVDETADTDHNNPRSKSYAKKLQALTKADIEKAFDDV